MIVTIHQPNYLPYLGFFHKMANADLFVVYDTALYSKQLGLHNRNRIKTPQGAQWLTVPVQHATLHALRDVQIVQGPWGTRHRLSLDANYKKAPFYASYAEEIRRVLEKPWTSLALLNEALIELVARWLSIPTKMIRASELPPPPADADATAKNIHLVRAVGGDAYLSGVGGHDYLDESQFADVQLLYDEFVPTPYPPLFGDFIPNLSAIDAVFNCGESVRLKKIVGEV